ncbi:MAG TPA: hypothetical protein DHV62_00130 [Elusimicrobia bacterium]|jgi:DNA primase large subunit|nr:hypothetical protein [Elusimicrobiota bacterium]
MSLAELKRVDCLRKMIERLEKKKSIPHYARLLFIMVARFHLSENIIIRILARQPDFSEEEAKEMLDNIKLHDYNPPHCKHILEWMKHTKRYKLCPSKIPGLCDHPIYKALKFPDRVYESIKEYHEKELPLIPNRDI